MWPDSLAYSAVHLSFRPAIAFSVFLPEHWRRKNSNFKMQAKGSAHQAGKPGEYSCLPRPLLLIGSSLPQELAVHYNDTYE